MKSLTARPRRSFAGSAIGQGDVVNSLDLRFIPGFKRDHYAVADRSWVAIEGLGQADPGTTAGLAPGDEHIIVHHPPAAELGK